MLKIKVINVTFSKQSDINLQFKPCTGDVLPINYQNEKVTSVVIITPFMVNNYKELKLTLYDLLVYTA